MVSSRLAHTSQPVGLPWGIAKYGFWRRGSMEVLERRSEKLPPALSGGIFPGKPNLTWHNWVIVFKLWRDSQNE
jgi:hypothetical protein